MRLKQWFMSIGDHNLDQQERLFRLLVMIGLCGLAAAIIIGIVIGEDKTNVIPLTIVLAVLACIVYFTLHFRKIQLGAAIIGAIIIYFVLPFNFMTAGGIYGGAPIYLLFGMVYVCLVVKGKVKYVFLASSLLISAVCYYIAYSDSSLVSQHTLDMAYIDSIMSLLIIGGLLCGMLLFQKAIFRSENELAKQQKQEIEELNRAQNRFFSGMSHEIRTPVNTIIGLNELILREDVSDEVAADAMNIQGAGKMLITLINDFLDMSKIESGKMDIVPVTYNVGDMLSDIVNMIWVRAKEKGLEFRVDVDQSVPAQLVGDEVRIKQILINVLNNAVKYTKEGSVALLIQSKEIQPNEAQISYYVMDTGMGIKQENIPYLFSAFQRVDEETNRHIEGTGLGLSIVKQLVELMGGEIEVKSVYTKGSTFIITLPQKKAGDATIENFDPSAKSAHSTRERYKQSFEAPRARVLIVDDNEMSLMVTKELLRNTKVQTDTVTSGIECLKKTLQNRYDVILMDYMMSDIDGIECIHKVRMQTGGLNQDTPIVILAANAGEEEQALYRRERVGGYLLKPISGIQLEEELLRHLPRELVSMTSVDGSVGAVETSSLTYEKKISVLITTESVCDLPKELAEKHQIAVVPYRVLTDSGEFWDGIEVETDGILSYINENKTYVRPVEPDVSYYEAFFAEHLTRAQYIVHFTMAKNIYYGRGNALEASKKFDNVFVVDSGHISSGMGLMVLQAAMYAANEMSAEAIIQKTELMKRRIRTSFIVDTTEYLVKTGKLAPKIHEVCEALMLHPVLVLKNSSIKIGAVKIGEKNRIRRRYIHATLKAVGEIDTRMLFIVYSGMTKEELDDIKEEAQRKVKFQNVIYQKVSPSVSLNCGPGSFGLVFMMK